MTTCGATRHPTLSLEDDVSSVNNDEMSFLQETRNTASIGLQEEEQLGRFMTHLRLPTYQKHTVCRCKTIFIPLKKNKKTAGCLYAPRALF